MKYPLFFLFSRHRALGALFTEAQNCQGLDESPFIEMFFHSLLAILGRWEFFLRDGKGKHSWEERSR